MKAITFTIHLIKPLLISKISAGEENSAETEEYISGSTIRGALIQRYRNLNPGVDISQDKRSRQLFFEGGCRFLNGYIEDDSGRRLLPRPFSWKVEKDDQTNSLATIHDLAIHGAKIPYQPASPAGNWTQLLKENSEGPNNCVLSSPAKKGVVHNSSNERKVKSAEKSTVFRYDSLAADQNFAAVIIGDEIETLIKSLDWKSPMRLNLGRSRDTEYGQVEFSTPKLEELWQECNENSSTETFSMVVTLISDAILNDHNGILEDCIDSYFNAKNLAAFCQTKVVGGYNRKWGLPLPQNVSIQAGSVFVYPQNCSKPEEIEMILRDGIGDRRVEGFGRVAVNWQTTANVFRQSTSKGFKQYSGGKHPPSFSKENLSENSKALLIRMGERMYQTEIERKLSSALATFQVQGIKENSQLSRIRAALHRADQQSGLNRENKGKDFEPILQHLEGLKSAKDAIHGTRVINNLEKKSEEMRFDDWIKIVIADDESWWNHWLKPAAIPQDLIPDQETLRKLRKKYTLLFLDAICKKTAKINQKEELNGGPSKGEPE